MRKNIRKRMYIAMAAAMMATVMSACGNSDTSSKGAISETVSIVNTEESGTADTGSENNTDGSNESTDSNSSSDAGSTDSSNEMFTDRDMNQSPDTSDAEKFTLSDGQDINITGEGTYIISGSASDVTIYVEAGDEDKVQLVLDGAEITNETMPCIYVKSADKVFVTTSEAESSLSVTGSFTADGDTNPDAVIFSKDDLVINGQGTLNITSTDNAVACKDEIKVTGGTMNIECTGDALEAHDAINIADGTINITSCNDGLHAEDSDDNTIGSIYIGGGSITIKANDDAIHGTTMVQIDGGDLDLTGGECIEGTYIKVNDGNINIQASDDGINAAAKSDSYTPTYEMNGGNVTIVMGAGDTDGVDSNGDIYMNGGTLDISGQSTFDCDGNAEYNGGTIIENGNETNTITVQDFDGGMGPGMGGENADPGMGGGMRPGGRSGDRMGPGNMNPQMENSEGTDM
ncbi:MAG: carbohydrate-binding domain-containing protein [Eubacterium sp.]|nr:carbohydrate-binding domain-containing protein [Eubacterium sp.]